MNEHPGLFVLKEDDSLVGLTNKEYESEARLQDLLAKYPALLAGDQIDPPRRWLLITRELGIPDDVDAGDRWSLDHLFVDQDAIPTLVEVKRSSDTGIRRKVVGQMLDYAANAVLHWPIEAIREAFERRCEQEKKSPERELQTVLGPNESPEDFWVKVKTNLQAERIRIVFVADAIPKELRTIVEFLNRQMDPTEVHAVEIRNYEGSGIRTLLPRVFGQTAQSEQKKSVGSARRSRPWDEQSFFAKLAERGIEAEVQVARALFTWSVQNVTRIDYGSGTRMATFIPIWRLMMYGFAQFGYIQATKVGTLKSRLVVTV